MGRLAAWLALLLLHSVASAQQKCDCGKILGACTATLEVVDIKGQRPNFSAGLKIRSSAPNCSLVEYFVGNTPARTLIHVGSIEFESLSSASPITAATVSYEGCRICAFKCPDGRPSPCEPGADAGGKTDPLATLQGTWCWSSGIVTGKNTFSGNSVRVQARALVFSGSNQGTVTVLNEKQFRITLNSGPEGPQDAELIDENSFKWEGYGGLVAQRCAE